MTPGRGPLEFSFSCERDNSVGSDPRKNSWPANLPYGLERRTMGLELEDTASSNALASLRSKLGMFPASDARDDEIGREAILELDEGV